MVRSILIALTVLGLSTPALAQQGAPTGYNAMSQHMVAPDGSVFQVWDSNGAYDAAATAAAYATYVSTHPQAALAASIQTTKLGFIHLLSAAEQSAFIVQEAQANALTAAQMANPTPQQQALITLDTFMLQFNAMGSEDTLSLADPVTVAAVNALLTLGVVATQARVTAILAGQPPS